MNTLGAMWNARNNLDVADYDERAYESRNLLQRRWQHSRHKIVLSMAQNFVGTQILHVGCGSSRILQDLPGAIGVDANERKVRYMQRYRANRVITGTATDLPFDDGQFECVICTGVLEHIAETPSALDEMLRVLHPQGTLIVGTPDWDSRAWRVTAPLAARFSARRARQTPTTRYTRERLESELAQRGWIATDVRYVFGAEMIGAFQRAATPTTSGLVEVLHDAEFAARLDSPDMSLPRQAVG